MARPKGSPKVGGRVKGTPNRHTVLVKEAIEDAFSHLQGTKPEMRKRFREWAEDNTDDFYKILLPKLLPIQLQHSGEVNISVFETIARARQRTET